MKRKHTYLYPVLGLVLILVLSSCRTGSFLEGYTDGSIPGIRQKLDRSPDSSLSILIVHGIGPTKKLNYADGLVSRITEMMFKEPINPFDKGKEINFYFDIDTLFYVLDEDDHNVPSKDDTTSVIIYQYPKVGTTHRTSTDRPQQRLKFYAVHWSNIADPFKRDLLKGDLYQLAQVDPKRDKNLYLNHLLKEFIVNQAFVDFLVYQNPQKRRRIQQAVMEGIKLMGLNDEGLAALLDVQQSYIDDTFDIYKISSEDNYQAIFREPTYCYVDPSSGDKHHEFVYIGRSFGSKTIIDVVNGQVEEALWKKYKAQVGPVCRQTDWLYLLPHQLPIIQLTDSELFTGEQRNEPLAENKIERLVSFNDANDLLGFYLHPDYHQIQGLGISNKITNVTVTNTEEHIKIKGSTFFFFESIGNVFG